MKIFLGISGASGVNLGLKLAREIAKRAQLHLCVSKNAMNVLEKELNLTDIFRKNGVNLNLIGGFGGKFDESANRSGVLKFNTSGDANKFGEIYGDASYTGADFQNLTPKLASDGGSQTRRDENMKFANLSSAQSESDFSGGSKNSRGENGEFISGGTQISSGENLTNSETIGGAGFGNRALDGTNEQFRQNSGKFDSDENEAQDAQIYGKFDDVKSQNKDDLDKISAKNKGEFLNKFDANSMEENLSKFDSEKYQNQINFDKNSACDSVEYLNKFDACFSDQNKVANSSKFDASKSQNKSDSNKSSSQKAAKQDQIYQIWRDLQNIAAIHDDTDLAAPPSSGSFGIDAAIIAPCSINTLAKIHAGFADTLITRAAAVVLKERKRLVLGVREMPISTLSLEHAAKLSSLGAVIAPPVLGYYSGQNSLEDMENFIIGKWLDLLGLEHQIYKRWS